MALIRVPGQEPQKIGGADLSIVEGALKEAASKGNELAGIVLRTALSPFPIQSPGRIDMILRSGAFESITGSLNIIVDAAARASRQQAG
jgi:hypothetical protein